MLNEAVMFIMTVGVKMCMDAMMFMIIHKTMTDMASVMVLRTLMVMMVIKKGI